MRAAGASFKVDEEPARARRPRTARSSRRSDRLFTGPTAIAYSKDPVAAAKVVVEFAKENEKLTSSGGALGEQQL